jgi:hypothetical protein
MQTIQLQSNQSAAASQLRGVLFGNPASGWGLKVPGEKREKRDKPDVRDLIISESIRMDFRLFQRHDT